MVHQDLRFLAPTCGSQIGPRLPRFMSFCSVTAFPVGAAFGLPVFALGVRRFTHPDNRTFAFSMFYAVLCSAQVPVSFVCALFGAGILDIWKSV